MKRTVSTVLAGALLVAACQGNGDVVDDPSPTPVLPAPDDTVDETVGATAAETEDETDAPTDDVDEQTATVPGARTGDDPDHDAGDTGDPDAPDLFDQPDWVDPEEQVQVAPGQDAYDLGQEITGVRIAGHDGFDRVVLDLSGDEVVLGWFGLYEDAAYEAGSGRPIDIAGNAVLSVPVEGIDWVNERPERSDGSDVEGGGTLNVVEVVFGVLFEGQQQVFVGVVDRTPYRVFPLDDPARIVIDVQHS